MTDPRKHAPHPPGATLDDTRTVAIPKVSREIDVREQEPASIRLEVLGGPMDGACHQGTASVATVGRSADNDLQLALDGMVSGHHCRIVREGHQFYLEDLESRNGTFLGEHRLNERAPIAPGTLFGAGLTRIEFIPQ